MDWTTHSQGPSTTRKCCCRTINCRRTSNSEMITPHGALLQALSAWYRSSCRSPLILHHMCASINDPTTPVCACELQAGGLGHVKCHVYCGGISKRLKVTWRLELAALLGCGWIFTGAEWAIHSTDPRYTIKELRTVQSINQPSKTYNLEGRFIVEVKMPDVFVGFSFTNVRMHWFSVLYFILFILLSSSTWSFFGFKLLLTSLRPYLGCCEKNAYYFLFQTNPMSTLLYTSWLINVIAM